MAGCIAVYLGKSNHTQTYSRLSPDFLDYEAFIVEKEQSMLFFQFLLTCAEVEAGIPLRREFGAVAAVDLDLTSLAPDCTEDCAVSRDRRCRRWMSRLVATASSSTIAIRSVRELSLIIRRSHFIHRVLRQVRHDALPQRPAAVEYHSIRRIAELSDCSPMSPFR